MGKYRRHSNRDDWWRQQYGGMPVWGLALAVIALVSTAAIAIPAALSQPARSEAAQPRPVSTFVAPSEEPIALFVGDSYTAGFGADRATRWTTLVSEAEGWDQYNHGRGGTGYATSSDASGCGRDYCETYPEQVARAAARDITPAVVVIAGGQNDYVEWYRDADAVQAGVADTFELARAEFPEARIIAVGPSSPNGVTEYVTALDAMVQTAAASVDADYVSLIDPDVLNDPKFALGDGAHVNELGHAAIAQRIIDRLTEG